MRASDLPVTDNAVDILERNLTARADKLALYTPERELTFRQVAAEAYQVGRALQRLDVRRGEAVALLCPDTAEWVTCFFGILKAGGVVAGTNTTYPPDKMQYQLNDCDAEFVFTLTLFYDLLKKLQPGTKIKHIFVSNIKEYLPHFIANALRYTRTGGVLVGCRRRGEEVEIQVLDTGPGVPLDALALIFEEFRRLEHPSPWGEKGLGLGLPICDRIARILAHRLVVHSTPGRGSLFAIRVPRSAEAAVRRGTADPRTRGTPVRGMTVLCLDDDPDILDGMAALLGRWGIEALTARTSADAEAIAGVAAAGCDSRRLPPARGRDRPRRAAPPVRADRPSRRAGHGQCRGGTRPDGAFGGVRDPAQAGQAGGAEMIEVENPTIHLAYPTSKTTLPAFSVILQSEAEQFNFMDGAGPDDRMLPYPPPAEDEFVDVEPMGGTVYDGDTPPRPLTLSGERREGRRAYR